MHIIGTLFHAKHHIFLPVDSSAAKMPFPVATMCWAIVASSFFCSVERAGNWCVMLGKEQKKNYLQNIPKSVIYRTLFFIRITELFTAICKYLPWLLNFSPEKHTGSSQWTNKSRVQSSLLNLRILQFSLQICAKRFTHLGNIVKKCTKVFFIHSVFMKEDFAVNENALRI